YAPGDHPPRLAWRLIVDVSVAQRWLVVVDALSGEVLTAFNEVPSEAQAGSGLDLFGERRPISVWSEDQLYLVDTSKPMFDPTSDPPSPDTTRGGIVILDAVNQPPTNNPKRIPELFYITSN